MFTLGTAGHIDHGKTTLCRHLTGIETDRLEEEKRRGISIELGFAELVTPRGNHVGIVDVPGHERFIRNMVAGVCGIDAFLFVVAADEGIMPQTREHFDILRILGVDRGLVILSKCDLADEDIRQIVREDVQDFLEKTPMKGCRILETSPSEPESYERVKQAVDDLLLTLKPRQRSGHFRMPIDRCFTIKGHGTVVTGTVATGTIKRGDNVVLLPEGISSRVRNVQSFGEDSGTATAGSRTALNLPDVPSSLLRRGSSACTPNVFEPTSMIDAALNILNDLPKAFSVLKHAARIRFYVGTSEVIGRVHIMDADSIKEGGRGLVQFRLETPVVASRGDKFLLRTFSPLYTIGGGIILDASPVKHKNRAQAARQLEKLSDSDPRELALKILDEDPRVFLGAQALSKRMRMPEEQLSPCLPPQTENAGILAFDSRQSTVFGSETRILAEKQRLIAIVDEYHAHNPSSPGMARASLQQEFSSGIPVENFNLLLGQIVESGDLSFAGKLVVRTGFTPRLDRELQRCIDEMRRSLNIDSELVWTPRALGQACGSDGKLVRKAIGLLLNNNELTRIPGGLFALTRRVEKMKDELMEFIRSRGGEADTNDIKRFFGLSRKHLIPFLEFLDECNVTLRAGNARRLRSG